jgi:hypothetical protein
VVKEAKTHVDTWMDGFDMDERLRERLRRNSQSPYPSQVFVTVYHTQGKSFAFNFRMFALARLVFGASVTRWRNAVAASAVRVLMPVLWAKNCCAS